MNRKAVNAWCMYDWANSGFATTVMAAVLPVYYGAVAAKNLPPAAATAYWGYTNTIGMLIVAFVAPALGAIADHSGSRKRFVGVFALLGIIFTSSMVLIGAGDWKLASVLYILALFGWSSANIFYDSLLPHIAGHDRIDGVSSRGYALGYLGGGILLVLNLLMIKPFDATTLKDIEKAIQASELGLTPNSDGKVIHLNLPPLTEDRRRELVKMVHGRLEETRVAVRNIRRDSHNDMREFEKEKIISEDDLKTGEEDLQKITDKFIEDVAELGKKKEIEIMEV